jgi:hypothetical protein
VQGPALAAFRCGTTGFCDQASFGLLIQLGLGAGARTFLQCSQPRFDEALAEAFDRRTAYREGLGDGPIVPALSRFEENTGACHFAGCVGPAVHELFELLAFLVPERDEVSFLGHRWSSSYA